MFEGGGEEVLVWKSRSVGIGAWGGELAFEINVMNEDLKVDTMKGQYCMVLFSRTGALQNIQIASAADMQSISHSIALVHIVNKECMEIL